MNNNQIIKKIRYRPNKWIIIKQSKECFKCSQNGFWFRVSVIFGNFSGNLVPVEELILQFALNPGVLTNSEHTVSFLQLQNSGPDKLTPMGWRNVYSGCCWLVGSRFQISDYIGGKQVGDTDTRGTRKLMRIPLIKEWLAGHSEHPYELLTWRILHK